VHNFQEILTYNIGELFKKKR